MLARLKIWMNGMQRARVAEARFDRCLLRAERWRCKYLDAACELADAQKTIRDLQAPPSGKVEIDGKITGRILSKEESKAELDEVFA